MNSLIRNMSLLFVCVFVPIAYGSDVTKMIQQELYRMNCQPGTVDGVWGNQTSSAYNALMADTGKKAKTCGESCGPEILAQVIGLSDAGSKCEYRESGQNPTNESAIKIIEKAIESCGEIVGTVKVGGGGMTKRTIVSRYITHKFSGNAIGFSWETSLRRVKIYTKDSTTDTKNFNTFMETDYKNIVDVRTGLYRGTQSVYLRGRPPFDVSENGRKDRVSEWWLEFCDDATAVRVRQAFIDLVNSSP